MTNEHGKSDNRKLQSYCEIRFIPARYTIKATKTAVPKSSESGIRTMYGASQPKSLLTNLGNWKPAVTNSTRSNHPINRERPNHFMTWNPLPVRATAFIQREDRRTSSRAGHPTEDR